MDTNTHIISQSTHETRFVFQDFEYTSNHEGIDVMCDAIFCNSTDYSRQCLQSCNPTARRSFHVAGPAVSGARDSSVSSADVYVSPSTVQEVKDIDATASTDVVSENTTFDGWK